MQEDLNAPQPPEGVNPAKKNAGRVFVTGVVLTRNGARLLDQCLASLSFCGEILVVDSGSTDETLAIAAQHGAKILRRDWTGFADQFAFAVEHVESGWFFILDQDEICLPPLASALLEAAGNPGPAVAFAVPRRSWYFDRFIKHCGWTPDYIPRLFQTGRMHFSQDAHIHYHPHGPLKRISAQGAHLLHYPYTGFSNHWSKLDVYAQQGADSLRAKGRRGGVLAGLGHGFMRFFKIYVLKLGFLDGRAGFLIAAHGAFYAFSKYVRVMDASWGEPFGHASEKLTLSRDE